MQAQALSNAGSLAQAQGYLQGARALQERARAIIREVDNEGARRGTALLLAQVFPTDPDAARMDR